MGCPGGAAPGPRRRAPPPLRVLVPAPVPSACVLAALVCLAPSPWGRDAHQRERQRMRAPHTLKSATGVPRGGGRHHGGSEGPTATHRRQLGASAACPLCFPRSRASSLCQGLRQALDIRVELAMTRLWRLPRKAGEGLHQADLACPPWRAHCRSRWGPLAHARSTCAHGPATTGRRQALAFRVHAVRARGARARGGRCLRRAAWPKRFLRRLATTAAWA